MNVGILHSFTCNNCVCPSSFFQSVCVLGYCLTPVAAALVVCKVILLAPQSTLLFFLRLCTTCLGFLWATYGNTLFLFILTPQFNTTVFNSLSHFPRRQSTGAPQNACRLPDFPVLLHSILAGHIAFNRIDRVMVYYTFVNV